MMDQRIIMVVIVMVIVIIIIVMVAPSNDNTMSSNSTEGIMPYRGRRRVFGGRIPIHRRYIGARGVVGGPIIRPPAILDCPLGYQLTDDYYCVPIPPLPRY